MRLRSQVQPGPLFVIAALAMAGAVLHARSEDRPYDDRAAFLQRLGPHELTVPDDITPAESDVGTPIASWPRKTVPILVSKTAVRVDLSDLTIPIPADGSPPRLEQLADAVAWANERFRELTTRSDDQYRPFIVTFLVDRDVPYGLLKAVVTTAASRAEGVRFVTRRGGELVAWSSTSPPDWPPPFRVMMTAEGFVVRGLGMPVETIPKAHGAWDFAALTEAGNRWKAASRDNVREETALVTATPGVRYQDLLYAERALRAEGTFPDVQWGIEPAPADSYWLELLVKLAQ